MKNRTDAYILGGPGLAPGPAQLEVEVGELQQEAVIDLGASQSSPRPRPSLTHTPA